MTDPAHRYRRDLLGCTALWSTVPAPLPPLHDGWWWAVGADKIVIGPAGARMAADTAEAMFGPAG